MGHGGRVKKVKRVKAPAENPRNILDTGAARCRRPSSAAVPSRGQEDASGDGDIKEEVDGPEDSRKSEGWGVRGSLSTRAGGDLGLAGPAAAGTLQTSLHPLHFLHLGTGRSGPGTFRVALHLLHFVHSGAPRVKEVKGVKGRLESSGLRPGSG
jgi:hypothetical protein